MISTEFLNDCLSGEEEAIQMLVRTYQRGVFQVALSVLDRSQASQEETAAQAEIATRETFVVALDRLGSYRIENAFEPWLYGITIQVSRRRAGRWQRARLLRRWLERGVRVFARRGAAESSARSADARSADARSADGLSTSAPGAETTGAPAYAEGRSETAQARARSDEALWNAVCGLNDTLRLPVILRYYHDFSVEQIARMLKVGVGAVHARLDQAREKIAALRLAAPP